jgi:hypothetical protein
MLVLLRCLLGTRTLLLLLLLLLNEHTSCGPHVASTHLVLVILGCLLD